MESSDSVLELANKSLELGNTLLESFNLLVTNDDNPKHEDHLKVIESTKADIMSPATNARLTKRGRVVGEIVETEKKYSDGLYLLLNHFKHGLRTSLSDDVLDILFPPCLQHIYLLHSEIHSKLNERVLNWSRRSSITDLLHLYFISNGDYMYNLYRQYLSTFSKAVSTLKYACDHDKMLRKRLENLEDDVVCRRLKIASYMTTPVQRMPRYILLIKELMKLTDKTSREYHSLDECVVSLGKYLTRLNEGIESSLNDMENNNNKAKCNDVNLDESKISLNTLNGAKRKSKRLNENDSFVELQNSYNFTSQANHKRKKEESLMSRAVVNNMNVVAKENKSPKKMNSFLLGTPLVWKMKKKNNENGGKVQPLRSTSIPWKQESMLHVRSVSTLEAPSLVCHDPNLKNSLKLASNADVSDVKNKGIKNALNLSLISSGKKMSTLKRKISSITSLKDSFRSKHHKSTDKKCDGDGSIWLDSFYDDDVAKDSSLLVDNESNQPAYNTRSFFARKNTLKAIKKNSEKSFFKKIT